VRFKKHLTTEGLREIVTIINQMNNNRTI
jgi:hypothetical protein